jgi:hypothetical protein
MLAMTTGVEQPTAPRSKRRDSETAVWQEEGAGKPDLISAPACSLIIAVLPNLPGEGSCRTPERLNTKDSNQPNQN